VACAEFGGTVGDELFGFCSVARGDLLSVVRPSGAGSRGIFWFFSEFSGNEAGHSCLLGWPPAHDATSCRRFRGVHAAKVERIRANPGAAPCRRESTGETLTEAKTGAGAKLGVAPFPPGETELGSAGTQPNERCPGRGCAKVHPAAGGVTSPAAVFFAIALDTCAMPPKIPRRQDVALSARPLLSSPRFRSDSAANPRQMTEH